MLTVTAIERGCTESGPALLDMPRSERLRWRAVSGAASKDALDRILTLQLAIGWAGEGKTDPPRLSWWRTSLNDEFGGEDLFKRLTPRTWRWAVLEAARAAARKVDAEARSQAADADQLVSLFRLGFELDEQVDDRLAELKRNGIDPAEALPELGKLVASWNADSFKTWLKGLGVVDVSPSSIGRRLKGEPPDDPVATAQALTAAMMPIADRYPAPHYKTSTSGPTGKVVRR
jgi:hypothetical protein